MNRTNPTYLREPAEDHDQWDCIQQHDGYAPGIGPCGAHIQDPGVGPAHEAYLRTATPEESAALAREFRSNLLDGYWTGADRDEDEDPVTDPARLEWFEAVTDFLMQGEDPELTEGMFKLAGHDGCKELAALRGWCPCGIGPTP